MRHNLLPAASCPESLRLVLVQQLIYEIFTIIRQFHWLRVDVCRDEVYLILGYNVIHALVGWIVVIDIEGREANNHLISQNT